MEELVRDYYEALRRFALRLAGNLDVAADLTQQTFLVALRCGNQLRDPQRVRSWLRRILHREFLQRLRRERRRSECAWNEVEQEVPAIAPAQIEQLDAPVVLAVLAGIDQRFREPLVLFYLDQLSYREIAGRLGLPVGTVMSRLSRGKNLLRRRLADSIRSADGTRVN